MNHPLHTQRQQGAALLMALLTVALVAVLASAALWQQWRTLGVESAERDAQQAHWLLAGAHDWARVVLREDARTSTTDHLAEPWATPLREARLSDFLAAAPGGSLTVTDGLAQQVFLSGRITDMQSRLNLGNLVVEGQLQTAEMKSLERLYQVLGLPLADLQAWTAAWQAAAQPTPAPQAPLLPQRFEQLAWLGVSPSSLARLAPYLTVLPNGSTVNLNTASAEVLYASVHSLNMSRAQSLVKERNQQPWDNMTDLRSRLGADAAAVNDNRHGLSTRFFEVVGQIRQDNTTVLERSLVVRDGVQTKSVWRERRALHSEPGCLTTIELPC